MDTKDRIKVLENLISALNEIPVNQKEFFMAEPKVIMLNAVLQLEKLELSEQRMKSIG